MSINSQNSAEVSHILGIDFGSSKVGLALADSEMKIASAYETLENDDQLLENLAKIIEENEVKKIILGVTDFHSQEDEKRRFGKLIEEKLGVEVEYQNEMFTTKIAQANLMEKGVKSIKKYDDMEAARIILQSWLDKL